MDERDEYRQSTGRARAMQYNKRALQDPWWNIERIVGVKLDLFFWTGPGWIQHSQARQVRLALDSVAQPRIRVFKRTARRKQSPSVPVGKRALVCLLVSSNMLNRGGGVPSKDPEDIVHQERKTGGD